jgi:hypothetical protein
MELPNKNYYNEKIINTITSLGYNHRIENYYVKREKDGYINIHYFKLNNKEYIEFHKNYYNKMYPDNTLNRKFNNYKDFLIFLQKIHKQEFRKIKINNLNNQ